LEFTAFYHSLQVGDSILSYKGFFSTPVLEDLLNMLEAKLIMLNEKESIRKRIFAICTEMLQNLFHREAMRWKPNWKTEYENVIFRLDKDELGYQIAVGNYIDELTRLNLTSKIEEVNAMSKESIKERYKEVLQTSEFTSKGGAGLGIIDIARRSNELIKYEILPVNENYCFFCILVKVAA
jgi:hypothetical protein